MLPRKVTRAEWHQSFSLDEIYKFETPTAKTISALNNNLKFFFSATRALPPERMWGAHDVRQFYQLYRKREKNIRVSHSTKVYNTKKKKKVKLN